jgi:molybdopterin-guanine dinucleotide biosynthesis protein A
MGGVDKQGIVLEGETMGLRIARQLLTHFDDVMVVGRGSSIYSEFPIRHVPDIVPGFGPLSGLHAALRASLHEWLYLVACDMPFFSDSWLEALVEKKEPSGSGCLAVVAQDGSHIEPFHALYNVGLIHMLDRRFLSTASEKLADHVNIQKGTFSFSNLIARVPHCEIPREEVERFTPDWRLFHNFNTEVDIADLDTRF